MKKQILSPYEAYQLIEPGPVVMVTTAHKGKQNVMTMAWHMVIEFKPPMLAFMLSDENYSFQLLQKSKECVLNIPSVELLPTVVKVGDCSGKNVDKFKKFGLTTQQATHVAAPLIAECFANIECKVIDTTMVKKYSIFIVEVVGAWIATSRKKFCMFHHHGKGIFTVDGPIIKMPFGKM